VFQLMSVSVGSLFGWQERHQNRPRGRLVFGEIRMFVMMFITTLETRKTSAYEFCDQIYNEDEEIVVWKVLT